MDPAVMGVLIPFASFAMVVLIVALTQVTKMRDLEMKGQQFLYERELEHQRKMKELEIQLEQAKRA